MLKTCNVNGKKVAYYKFGKTGRKVLLVHGFAIGKEIWDEVLPHLNKNRVYVVDLPGHGKNTKVKTSGSIRDQAIFLQNFIKTVGGIDIIIGYSYGGRVVYRLCEMRILNISRVIIIGSPFLVSSISNLITGKLLMAFSKSAKVSRALIHLGTTKLIFRRILSNWRLAPSDNEDLINRLIWMIRKGQKPSIYLLSLAEVFVRQNETISDTGITYIYGGRDGSATADMAKKLIRTNRHGDLKIIRGAYHLLPLEYPKDLAQILNNIII